MYCNGIGTQYNANMSFKFAQDNKESNLYEIKE